MKILVTGATGVLGRRVLPLLAAAGHDVAAVARSRADQVRAAGARPLDLDLFDAEAVRRAVAGRDAVLDLATHIPPTSQMLLPWAWRDTTRLRTIAARHAADAAIAAGARYVRESIAMLYADAGDQWVTERFAVAPIANTRAALAAEDAAASVTRAGGVGIALRLGMLYGPDSGHTRDQLAAARRGRAGVLGDPDGFVTQLHLDDAATAIVAALDAPPGLYNVGEADPLRRRELVAVWEEALGRPLRTPPGVLGRLGAARAVSRSVRVDSAAFHVATGWKPRHDNARTGLPAVLAAMDRAAT